MKTFFTILSLLLTLPLIGQKISNGYIITAENDTLRGKLNITVNKKVKITSAEHSGSFEKQALLDYGGVEEGKWTSYYAKTAFKHKCKKAILYSNRGDSTAVYLYVQGTDKLHFYDQEKQKNKKRIGSIAAYKVLSEDGTWNRYERLAVPNSRTGMLGEVKAKKEGKKRGHRNSLAFGKRLAGGKIDLFSTTTVTTSASPGLLTVAPGVYNNSTSIYLLQKGEQKEILPKGKLQIKDAEPIKAMMADYPELAKKIGTKGYKLKDIKKIVEEYNQYWLDLEG